MSKTMRVFLCVIFSILGIGIIISFARVFAFNLQDVLYLSLFVVCLEACLLISIITSIEDELISEIDGTYKTAYIRKSVWLKSYIIWMVINFWMVSASFLATLIVIYITSNDINKVKIIFYSIMSIFTSIISYVLNPMSIAKGYRLAYQEIDKAIFKYQNSGKKKDKILSTAINKGEQYINKYSFK